jgi:hypothetical protein
MWVQLKIIKQIEVQGRLKRYDAGDWVNVGKQTALQWFAEGACTSEELELMREREEVQRDDLPAVRLQRRAVALPPLEADTITIFAVPMAFKGDREVKQDNALGSWARLEPRPVVFLFGDEKGIDAAAVRHGAMHLPHIERNQFGTPVVADAFHQMQKLAAPHDVVCYVNSDIILLQDWMDALRKTQKKFNKKFLAVGRRWDVDLNVAIQFHAEWVKKLRARVAASGKLHSVGAIDFFAFRPGVYEQVPHFYIGRSAWDNWLVGHAVREGIDTVDLSPVATVIHQDMPGPKVPRKGDRRAEWEHNQELYNADREGVTGKVTECKWVLEADGFHQRNI